jgi:uncharacterized protein
MTNLIVLEQTVAICQLSPDEDIPAWLRNDVITAIVRTPEELSVVCDEKSVPDYIKAEKGWRILKIEGKFNFTEVGILAAIVAPLAEAGVSVLTLATFDTDYIMVKNKALSVAVEALRNADHNVEVS